NLISVRGNHDDWFYEFIRSGSTGMMQIQQGQYETLKSYAESLGFEISKKLSGISSDMCITDVPNDHVEFFKNQRNFYIDEKNRCFVHGGFDRSQYFNTIEFEEPSQFYWDRD